jgi:hypothetical protein
MDNGTLDDPWTHFAGGKHLTRDHTQQRKSATHLNARHAGFRNVPEPRGPSGVDDSYGWRKEF